jgi:hypothetical protein
MESTISLDCKKVCKFGKSTYSTTLYAHVIFYKFSNYHANNLTQIFCGLCFLPFYFNSRLCTSHLFSHSCYYMTRSQVTGWNPVEGFTKSSCGKLKLGGTLPASNSRKG